MKNRDVLNAYRRLQKILRNETMLPSSTKMSLQTHSIERKIDQLDQFHFYKTKACSPPPHLKTNLFKKHSSLKIFFLFALSIKTHAPNLDEATAAFQRNISTCILHASIDTCYLDMQSIMNKTWPQLDTNSEFLSVSQSNVITQNAGLCKKLLDLRLIRILDANDDEVIEPSNTIILQASTHNFVDNMRYLLTQFAAAHIPQEAKELAESCLTICQQLLPNIPFKSDFIESESGKFKGKDKQSYINYITTASTLSVTSAFVNLLCNKLRMMIEPTDKVKVMSPKSQHIRRKLFIEDIKATMAKTSATRIKIMCEILAQKIYAETQEEALQPTKRQSIFLEYLNALLSDIEENPQYELQLLVQHLANKVLNHISFVSIHFFESKTNPKHQAISLIGILPENQYINSMGCITFYLSLDYFAQLIADATTLDIDDTRIPTEEKITTIQSMADKTKNKANANVVSWLEELSKTYNTDDLATFIEKNHNDTTLFHNCTMLEERLTDELAETETFNLCSNIPNKELSGITSPTPEYNTSPVPTENAAPATTTSN